MHVVAHVVVEAGFVSHRPVPEVGDGVAGPRVGLHAVPVFGVRHKATQSRSDLGGLHVPVDDAKSIENNSNHLVGAELFQ